MQDNLAKHLSDEPVADYLSFYGLAQDPFVAVPPLLIESQEEQVEKIHHISHFSEALVAVIGPEESGKTTLIDQLVSQQPAHTQIVHLVANVMSSSEQVLEDVCHRMGINATGYQVNALIELVRVHVEQMADRGENLLIVIDDAQHLDPIALAALLNLTSDDLMGSPPQLILVGDESLEDTLSVTAARANLENAYQFFHVKPLELADIQLLLDGLYRRTAQQPLPFDDQDIADIFDQSEGWVGAVLRHSQDKLIQLAGGPAAPKPKPFPIYHMLGITVIACALFLSWSLIESKETANNASNIADGVQTEADNSGTASTAAVKEKDVVEETAQDANSIDERLRLAEQKLRQELSAPAAATAKTEETASVSNTEEEAALDKLIIEEQQASANTQTSKPQAKANKTTQSDHSINFANVQDAQYCIQLLGTREESSAIGFIEKYQQRLNGDFAYFKTAYKGQAWYVVVYGRYGGRDNAVSAIDSLPVELRRQQPWVRSFKSIRADVVNMP